MPFIVAGAVGNIMQRGVADAGRPSRHEMTPSDVGGIEATILKGRSHGPTSARDDRRPHPDAALAAVLVGPAAVPCGPGPLRRPAPAARPEVSLVRADPGFRRRPAHGRL